MPNKEIYSQRRIPFRVVDIAFGRGRYKENLFVGTEIGNSRGELQIWDLERVDKPVQVINESRGMISSIGKFQIFVF
jgi:hypothetical protein